MEPTAPRGSEAGLSARQHLDGHNAYPFFQVLEDLVITGPTNTNVMDLNIVLIERSC